ncbi:hypothetical protein D1822_00110 [Phaeobacter inhibens]|uniref:hypothetical protein n=1 Tax=Phaeobacter inhibens TaxID=221822 RepID=UPI0001632EA8|nr:hypothetical protein [Phaeobacter inhibens]AFO89771.1 hypothetical protein PGA1_c00230 [Phaeobacter inhibens DSM 17395]AUQ44397.1 hypothetical protein PhaeoP10_00022 [Phaeobacter inhibens]AXT21329.1 hypothetical protein D1822_00110 [Phaeobacter inhibens]
MSADILHSGFDGLKFTVETDIPPALREALAEAKALAIKTNAETVVEFGPVALSVRRTGGSAFSAHTGEYGAEWYFLDPENRAANNPGITVDFRAFLLATGGLDAAEKHFRTCMDAFGIRYADHLLRVTRVDYAIDFLAPWFEPDREALVVPPGTRVQEYTGVDETETHATGARVTGLRAGAVANRQLAIYDKRQEVMQKGKLGWLTIWNDARAQLNRPPLDLSDRLASQVWRFELRMGSKQLRNRWEMRSWQDLRDMVGDAYSEFCEKIRYTCPTSDSNRARWPTHDLWQAVASVIANDLHENCSGVLPSDVIETNRAEHMRMLDRQILGLFVSRAAASEVQPAEFQDFLDSHIETLKRLSEEHPTPLPERLSKAAARYRFK